MEGSSKLQQDGGIGLELKDGCRLGISVEWEQGVQAEGKNDQRNG